MHPLHFVVLVIFLAITYAEVASKGTALVNSLPKCAKPCHKKAAKAVGCVAADLECLCRNQDVYTSQAKTCVTGACWIGDSMKVKGIAEKACVGVGGHEEL